jgi:hypothetical protein
MRPFEWGVATTGYQWREGYVIMHDKTITPGYGDPSWNTRMRFLTPGTASDWRIYRPLETPHLLETFANIELTERGIEAFANTFGMLAGGWQVPFVDGPVADGETFAWWEQEVLAVRHALRVWATIQAGDQETLTGWFHLKEAPPYATICYGPGEPLFMWIARAEVMSVQSLHERWGENPRLLHAERPFCCEVLNMRAGGLDATGLAVTWLQNHINRHLWMDVGAAVSPVDTARASLPMDLEIVPKNLRGALWLQLAEALRRHEGYQQCPICHQVFHVHAKARRASTTYCSPRCRVRAARQRQTQAGQAG